jgi:hypothetical protein
MDEKVRHYIELGVRSIIAEVRPDYWPKVVQEVVDASMKNLPSGVTKQALIRAIEIAVKDLEAK